MGELTKAVALIICWKILKERRNRRYDNKASSSITILNRVVNDLQDFSFLSKPYKDAGGNCSQLPQHSTEMLSAKENDHG